MSDDVLEDQRLASFEQGYSAGWEDAIDAQAQEQGKLTERFVQSVEDMSFGYHEAQGQLIETLTPVFRSLIDVVLPTALNECLGQHLVEQLSEIAQEEVEQPVFLHVPAGMAGALRPVLVKEVSMPLRVTEDAALGAGQVHIRVGDVEREIDAEHLLNSIREAVAAFIYQSTETKHHA
ncbi:ABC transporter ATP-binding protein [Primorskyibacter sp. S87]|uniref:ABC transporter ATP-binding protein n=1 Tax=Primorskyibacter sp. S87 TaxID=3415126 RepID=UPI003C7B5191